MRVQLRRRVLRLARPLPTAHGEVREREVVELLLSDETGTGVGESCPFPGYDGVSMDRAMAALSAYRPILEGGRLAYPPRGPQLLDACRAADPLPQALAAVDLALWDLAAQREGSPVAALLSDRHRDAVPVNATIGATDRAGAAEQAARAVNRGFRCVKLKVGVGDDAGRVAAVRAAAGPEVDLRLDANGAWTVPEAVRAIESLAPAGLELVEEPVHGLRAVREVRERVAVRIAIDETAAEPGALGAGVADAVCLKISRCGGISGLLAAAALVRAGGGEVYVSSTLDGPVGVAAALHAASALAGDGALPACGLATLELFEGLEGVLPVVEGRIRVPEAPGLGVSACY